ncbi:uncharacterized protein LOC131244531 [Magnolia sinica]|uniref:uncharacterized protein LOC131244531 n=1 Tax=Magnolia sinica TaxID=86752 RepID=UPI002658AD91|nr:uncharacterized protein LOC131244531 [Magnolia sinica]
MATTDGHFCELMKKYGKVALDIHFSVSAASIIGLYVAIKNNVDVESLFDKIGLSSFSKPDPGQDLPAHSIDGLIIDDLPPLILEQKKNRTSELAASSEGALALAVICNKALFPVRVPITIALTPAVSRFLARWRINKNSV